MDRETYFIIYDGIVDKLGGKKVLERDCASDELIREYVAYRIKNGYRLYRKYNPYAKTNEFKMLIVSDGKIRHA